MSIVLDMNDLISVIVPIYKVEKYLVRCIESILNQTYQNLEIVLVDDGSPDNCPAICDKYRLVDNRIRVIHKENGGLSDARNAGIKNCTGDYCVFVDSDDYIDAEFVECLHSLAIKHHVKVACVGYQMVSDTVPAAPSRAQDSVEVVYSREDAIRGLFDESMYADFAWNKIFHRSLFDRIVFPIHRTMEDLGTIYKAIDCCDQIAYSSRKLYYYYQRDDSILHQRPASFYCDLYTLGKERYDYLERQYPNMKENHLYYFILLTNHYYYFEQGLKKEARKELIRVYQRCKNDVVFKDRCKYYLIRYAPKLHAWLKGLRGDAQ